jgi:hypothetical protein
MGKIASFIYFFQIGIAKRLDESWGIPSDKRQLEKCEDVVYE